MKQIQKSNRQSGFTLIELVVVIVILGILAATALPKFVNLQTDARVASINAARGGTVSAMNLAHAKFLVAGTNSGSPVTIEGVTATNVMGSGYPKGTEVTGPTGLAGLSTEYSTSAGSTITTYIYLASAASTASCSFTYTDATTSIVAATISATSTTGC